VVLDGLLGEEERSGDLLVRASLGDEPGDVELAGGERTRALGADCAAVLHGDARTQPAQFARGGVACEKRGAAGGVDGHRAQHGNGLGAVAGSGERASGEQPGGELVTAGADPAGGLGSGHRHTGGVGRLAGREHDLRPRAGRADTPGGERHGIRVADQLVGPLARLVESAGRDRRADEHEQQPRAPGLVDTLEHRAAGGEQLADAAFRVLLLSDRGDGAASGAGQCGGLQPVQRRGGLGGRAYGITAVPAVVVDDRLGPQRGVEQRADVLQPRALLRQLDVGERVAEVDPLLLELCAGDREPAQHPVLARGPGHGERAIERRVALLEALAQQRGRRDVHCALQPGSDRVVLDTRQPRQRAVEQRGGRVGVTGALRPQRTERLGAGAQRVLARAGVARRPSTPVAHGGTVAGVEPGGGHLERQRRAARRRCVIQRGQQPPARVAVAAEQVLHAGALGDDREPSRRALGREQGEHVEQRLSALVQPPRGRERERHRAEQSRAPVAGGVR
jgi:hypothetical protein